MEKNEKSITLEPSWKAFFWEYVAGILLSPLLIGILILWRVFHKQSSISYKISDRQITIIQKHISQNIDLVDIRQAQPTALKMGVGSIILKTAGRNIKIIGIERPSVIASSIEQAAEAERRKRKTEEQAKPRPVQYAAGEMDRLDYLTGLWQQGLLSEDDFQAEKGNL
jgi:hypothetical protein